MNDMLKIMVLWVLILSIPIAIGVYYGKSKPSTVQCVLITPAGAVKTVEFEDESVTVSDGAVKGKTKVYRLGDHEACLITEKE